MEVVYIFGVLQILATIALIVVYKPVLTKIAKDCIKK